MGFLTIWVTWIRACLNSTSFSLLINGQPIGWFSPARGVRQGDPIFPYLFIIVSQNLFAILNHAWQLNMILGFWRDLNYDFNRLMYADNLMIVISSSRRTA